MADDRIRWIDLSAYQMTLHALRLPSGRVALVAAGNTGVHASALRALGFRRTRQGHILQADAEIQLTFSAVRAHFPAARVRDLARDAVVRLAPSGPPAAPLDRSPDHWIHHARWLGVNRRGQFVYEDGAEHRYLVGDAEGEAGPLTDSDYLRLTEPDRLPEVVAGLVCRAERDEKLTSDALQQLAHVITVPPGQSAPSRHALQEALEAAAVRRFRAFAAGLRSAWRDGATPPEDLFRAAQRLAQNLPPVATRSGDTLAWAQFSTPLPLAVAARTLLGPIGPDRSVLEPTAGHGALLLGLPEDIRLTAVEIDPDRAQRLERILRGSAAGDAQAANDPPGPLRVLTGDILRLPPAAAPYDYILANPPYGRLAAHRLAAERSVRVRLGAVSFPTQRLDHWILLETLKQRHPLGRAVYLISADHPRHHALDTPTGGSRYLLNLLSDHYHVEAVIGLHGDLYGGQGAHYPLRLVVVGQQGAGFPPAPEQTPVARTWDELWTLVESLARQLGPSARERAAPITAPDPAPPTGEPTATPEANAALEEESDEVRIFQERYVARSQVGEATTMIPANMASAVRRALDRVEAATGLRIDDYVARELGRAPDTLDAILAPEQIDAIALAFHAHDRGRGFIEADETGIGKGRVLAAAALRAWRQGRPVIFLTEKPNLFSDFYRDLSHLGARDAIRLLMVNTDVPIKDTERGVVLAPATRPADLQRILHQEAWPAGVNLVLATYSQLSRPASPKSDWLCRIAEQTGAQVIADESHNASGDSTTAVYVQRLIEASGQPPLFSSATYAKRPDNLAIYATVLPTLFRGDDLGAMLRQGGAPLQEVFSQMLAEDGVLIRREHDLSNITFRVEPDAARAARNRTLADRLASILEKMAWLGGDIEAFISRENQRLNERFQPNAGGDQRHGHRAGLHVINFGSRLYQLNRLFLLALKVDHAIAFGDREIAAGRKPVFVLENTLETLLRDIITPTAEAEPSQNDPTRAGVAAADAEACAQEAAPPRAAADAAGDLFAGQVYPMMTYRDALHRVLKRMMEITERDRYGNTTRRPLHEDALLALARTIEQDIDAFPDLPLAPLDTLRIALQERGYRMGELSGRAFQVEWVERRDGRAMRIRPRPPENRSDLIYRFNTDVYQGLILTRSGATGLSLHARNDLPGWSAAPRTLFELQIPQNVAERIQFWGRVNRRGQCAAPTVITPSSELPGEARLIAMQNKKLRQLSANTTSNQDNAALAHHVPDLLNPIGNQIARRWVTQNPIDAQRLDASLTENRDALPEGYIHRVMSRILLFPVAEQEALLEEIAGLYRARLEELKSQGIQPLRTAEFDWKATEIAREIFEATPAVGRDADSPFHAPIDYVTVEYPQVRRPLRADRVRAALAQEERFMSMADTQTAFQRIQQDKLRQSIQPHGRYAGYPSVFDGLNAPEDNPVKRTARQLERIATFLQTVQQGSLVAWYAVRPTLSDGMNPTAVDAEEDEAPERELRRGLVIAVRPPATPETLHLSGHYQVIIACPGEERLKAVTLHTLLQGEYTLAAPDAARAEAHEALWAAFDQAESGVYRRRCHLLAGNLYAALQLAARDDIGRPAIYTTATGGRERGVLLDTDITLDLLRSKPVLLRSAEHLQRFVAEHPPGSQTALVSSHTGGRPERYKRGIDFVLILQDGQARLIAPGAHARNGVLLHDPRWQALDIPLEGNRTALEGLLPPDRLADALAVLGAKSAWYAPAHYREWYNRIAENHDETPESARPSTEDRDPAPSLSCAPDPPRVFSYRRASLAPRG